MLGVPVAGLGALCAELASRLPALGLQDTPIVWTCKGFEAGTARLPHEIVREALPQAQCGVLSGPSFAREVAQGLPVALTIASSAAPVRERTIQAFHGAALRVYASADLVGVEVGGALKNDRRRLRHRRRPGAGHQCPRGADHPRPAEMARLGWPWARRPRPSPA